MEVRDPLHGSIELTPPETAVIDQAFFQRLRNIKQLGFTEFAFPGATHNRYCHSLGAMHLAGRVFDHIFQGHKFTSKDVRWRFRQLLRLGALLHDIGHGPLSHTTEEVMPPLSELQLNVPGMRATKRIRANHEDYTLKIITDSSMTAVLKSEFSDLSPLHIAQLIDLNLTAHDDFFIDGGLNFRPILCQLVSSELDVDRMDYLVRDSYYCGTSYGHIDSDWLIANLTYHEHKGSVHLALNRRALYTFDDFLISRLHMFLMVYFHHKAIIYDEMLLKYLKSPDCTFFLPAQIENYLEYDDYRIHSHLAKNSNPLASMIAQRRPYRLFFEGHFQNADDVARVSRNLESEGLDFITASSTGKLSKYYYPEDQKEGFDIFVIEDNHVDPKKVTRIEEATQIYKKYEDTRRIDRVYVSPHDYVKAQKILGKV